MKRRLSHGERLSLFSFVVSWQIGILLSTCCTYLQEATDTVTVDKVLDQRRGLPGATGPATTIYSVKQRGDPNQEADTAR